MKRKTKKPREWWVVTDAEDDICGGWGSRWFARRSAEIKACQAAKQWNSVSFYGPHKVVHVREVLPKKRKVKK
jgi:hypothetical protein